MAEPVFLSAVPSMADATHPTDAATYVKGDTFGIDSVLSGAVITDCQISKQDISEPYQDQKGSVVGELSYDQRWDMTMSFFGPSAETGDISQAQVSQNNLSFAGKKWKVDSITFQGQSGAKKMYSLQAHAYRHYPAQS